MYGLVVFIGSASFIQGPCAEEPSEDLEKATKTTKATKATKATKTIKATKTAKTTKAAKATKTTKVTNLHYRYLSESNGHPLGGRPHYNMLR